MATTPSAAVRKVLGEDARPVRTFPAAELVGREYEPPFPYIEGAHRVVDAPFVTTGEVATAGPLYAKWFNSAGAQGKEPPARMKELMDKWRKAFGVPEK